MTDPIVAASIAASAALIIAFLTQFLAENYRCFKTGSSIAAGIVGELKSYEEALPMLRLSLRHASEVATAGRKDEILLRPLEKPVDRYFDEVIGDIGLLGPELVEQIIYVYNNLNAFRTAFVQICSEHQKMDATELIARILLCSQALERAASKGVLLEVALKERYTRRFFRFVRSAT